VSCAAPDLPAPPAPDDDRPAVSDADGEVLDTRGLPEFPQRQGTGIVSVQGSQSEEAVAVGTSAFTAERRSLPSLLLVAADLRNEIIARRPDGEFISEYEAKLAEVTKSGK
jgi:hypothetical protein